MTFDSSLCQLIRVCQSCSLDIDDHVQAAHERANSCDALVNSEPVEYVTNNSGGKPPAFKVILMRLFAHQL